MLLHFAEKHKIVTNDQITEDLVLTNSKALQLHLQSIIHENQ